VIAYWNYHCNGGNKLITVQEYSRRTIIKNIPTRKVAIIIQTILNNQNTQQNMIRETENIISHIVLPQNYFQFNIDYYKQEGLAMGAPSSAYPG
jgi:hypothetical protein